MRGDSDREAQPNHGQVPSEYIRRCLHARGESTGPNIVEEDAVVQEFLGLIFVSASLLFYIYMTVLSRPALAEQRAGPGTGHTLYIFSLLYVQLFLNLPTFSNPLVLRYTSSTHPPIRISSQAVLPRYLTNQPDFNLSCI